MEWKIAKYLRLSKEDGDKEESDSIASQRTIINNFVKNYISDCKIIGEFIDDGYTGLNFNRPNFKKMIELIEKEEVNCVVVKDLSRFGRDYIGVGEYLEKYFPYRDIRFIAINDNYDTLSATSNDEFIMPIKNIFNAHYSKDISRKVKSSFRALQSEGKFVGAFASYGYLKDEKDRHKLVIDEPAAVVIRRIFEMYNSGQGKISIARKLNEEKIPCPSEYKLLSGLNYTNGNRMELTKYWTYSTIHRILSNEMYLGNMVQNKTIRKTVRGNARKNSEENWIISKGTHEPIIDAETWNITQSLLTKNTRQLDFEQNVGLFAGYMFCGNCNRAMSKVTNKYKSKKTITYICGSYKRYGERVCRRNAVKVDFIENLVLEKLNEQIERAGEIKYNKSDSISNQTDISKFEILLEKNNKMKKSLYEDYREGILTKEEYLQYKSDYQKEDELIIGQIEAIRNNNAKEDDEKNEWIETLLKHKKIERLDRETVAEVLDKIVITSTEEELKIDIIFRFELL